MPVGAGSIKRAARTANAGEGQDVPENAVNAEEGRKTAAKKTEAKKPAAEKQVKRPVKKTAGPAEGTAGPNGGESLKTAGRASAKEEASRQKTYGINEELPFYLM